MRLLIALLLLLIATSCFSQLVVDESITPEQAVQDILAGEGLEVFNISFSGDGNQLGSFESSNSNVGLDNGILLCSGSVLGAIGPNDTSSHTEGGGNVNASDPDLELLTGEAMNDAAILQFDFIPQSDSVFFRYVFASEEYDEYVCSSFNDAFGFFLSGPGLSGPYSNNGVNISLIPNSNTPVSINTINPGVPGIYGGEAQCESIDPNWIANAVYYVDNNTSQPQNIQYDGLTVVLTASSAVQCGETYHMKIVVADAYDDNLDSGIFLEASGFSSQGYTSQLEVAGAPENWAYNQLPEGCLDALLTISRPNADVGETILLTVNGTATADEDYIALPSSIFFEVGEFTASLTIQTLIDDETEISETIIITYAYLNTCGETIEVSTTLEILDYLPPAVSLPSVMEICEGQTAIITSTVTGGVEPLNYLWSDGTTGTLVNVDASVDIIEVTVSDFCGQSASSTSLIQVPLPLEVTAEIATCENEAFEIEIEGGLAPFVWLWDEEGLNFTDGIWEASEAGMFSVNVTDACLQEADVVVETVNCALTIANVFSPNADGVNDYFRIIGLDNYSTKSLAVVDRWGMLVFQTDHYLNNWDGYNVGDGVYYYTLDLGIEVVSGNVTILR
jgi:gliding motility-associated-like protein